jgi:hypothetical protein
MASFTQVTRPEKKRVSSELHDNLASRAANGPPDALLDPLIAKFATSRDALGEQVDGKSAALAEGAAALVTCDIDDDEVDRWYRHVYYYVKAESLRRHAPQHASINALLSTAYPDGLAHVDDRIPDQNEEVRKTIVAFRDPQFAETLVAIELPTSWIDKLEAATHRSAASFAAYQATSGHASTAVALGRDAEEEWVQLARTITHTIALRSVGAAPDVVEEGKRLIAPLTNAVRLIRTESRARETKRKNNPPKT